jgi:hypothetical protein
VPGGTVELRALADWTFCAEQAAAITRPVLSVVGAETQPMWVEIADFLRASLPCVEESTIDGVGHLLQIQQSEPVAREIAEFLERNSMADDKFELIDHEVASRARWESAARPELDRPVDVHELVGEVLGHGSASRLECGAQGGDRASPVADDGDMVRP